jgi:hypothetical protein
MKGEIYLNPKEARRICVLEQLVTGVITVPQAARLLGLSNRQVQRLKGGYIREGEASRIHKNRGKHAVPDSVRKQVIDLALAIHPSTASPSPVSRAYASGRAPPPVRHQSAYLARRTGAQVAPARQYRRRFGYYHRTCACSERLHLHSPLLCVSPQTATAPAIHPSGLHYEKQSVSR